MFTPCPKAAVPLAIWSDALIAPTSGGRGEGVGVGEVVTRRGWSERTCLVLDVSLDNDTPVIISPPRDTAATRGSSSIWRKNVA